MKARPDSPHAMDRQWLPLNALRAFEAAGRLGSFTAAAGSLTVAQNLRLVQYLADLPQRATVVDEILASLQLTHRRHARPHTLSQGEAQRVAIARALLNRPQVILADEPTASLDDENCYRVLRLLRAQAERYRATLVIATHDQRLKQEMPYQLTLRPE